MSADKPAATGSGEPTIVCAWRRREQGECLRDKLHCTRNVDEQRDLQMERQMIAGYERGLAAHCSDYAANHPSSISADTPQLCAICGKRPWIWDLKCEECNDATPPASQPVTLSAEEYITALRKLVHLKHLLSPTARIDGGKFDLLCDALALLRAAEQREVKP